jgi:mono/diheme cytochrome c family protein
MNAKTRNGIFIAVAIVAYFGAQALTTPFATPYARGKELVVEMGCISCHSPGTSDLTPNPSSSPKVPHGQIPSLVASALPAEDFQEWVLEGSKLNLAESQRWLEQKDARAIGMPAYKEFLGPQEVSDIRAWALIEGRETPSKLAVDQTTWTQAEALAKEMGCFVCHGPLGQGGVSNPGSFTTKIPGLTGEDFEHLTAGADREAIREWIRDGVSERFLEGDPLAFLGEMFMSRQRTQMPAFGELMSEAQIDLLVEYCVHLYELGPLTGEGFESYRAANAVNSPKLDSTSDERVDSDSSSLPEGVRQIFSSNCLSCHGPKKQKSGYRLDSRAAALQPGEISSFLGVQAIAPGNPEASLLMRYILATEEAPEDELFPMPPDEEDHLNPDQIATIEAWIRAGAPWGPSQVIEETNNE